MANKNYDHLFKLLLIGDSDAGKTSILYQFKVDADQPENSMSAIGIDFAVKTILVNGERIKLQIWDTAGQERFHTITTSYYRGAKGVMLVYDVTNAKSFENIPKWLSNVKQVAILVICHAHSKHTGENIEVLLLGNRCHLQSSRKVSREQGEALALEHGMRFMEVSDTVKTSIEQALYVLIENIYKRNANPQ